MKKQILRNRYTLLLSTLIAYVVVLVAEGAITGREVIEVEFENPYFDLNLNNLDGFRTRRNEDDDGSDSDASDSGRGDA